MITIKQAVILSAGLGTRLRPYTDTMPKPMIPILGCPMLEWHIEQFRRHGVTEFFINTHYLPDVIKSYFGDGSSRAVKIHYSFEPVIRGTAGGIKRFEPQLDDAFFAIYGDTFSLVDYSKMRSAFVQHPDAIGMQRMKKTDDYADADVAELNSAGRFTAIHPKPHTQKYTNAHRMRGVFILKKEILSFVPPNTSYEIGRQLLPNVIKSDRAFYGYECDEYSKGIDTEEKWREVETYLKENTVAPWWK